MRKKEKGTKEKKKEKKWKKEGKKKRKNLLILNEVPRDILGNSVHEKRKEPPNLILWSYDTNARTWTFFVTNLYFVIRPSLSRRVMNTESYEGEGTLLVYRFYFTRLTKSR